MGLQNSITVQFFKNLRRYILPKSILICTIAFSMMGLAKNAYAADYFFIGALDVEFDQSSLWPLNGGSASGPTPITKSPTNSWGSGDVANLGGGGSYQLYCSFACATLPISATARDANISSGTINFNNGSTLNLLTSGTRLDVQGGILNLNGTTNINSGTDLYVTSGTVAVNGIQADFNILAGGKLHISSLFNLINTQSNNSMTMHNGATLSLNTGGKFLVSNSEMIQAGNGSTFDMNGGSLEVATGQTLIFQGSSTVVFNWKGGLIGDISNTGTITLSGVDINLINISGPSQINQFAGGTMFVAGNSSITIDPGVTFRIENGATFKIEYLPGGFSSLGTIQNLGTFDAQSTTLVTLDGAITNAGTFNVKQNLILNASSFANTLGSVVVDATKTLTNSGTFNYNSGTITNNGTIINDGNFNALGTSLEIAGPGAFTNNGTLTGNLTIAGQVTNNGIINPGNSPGYIEASGGYVENGTLNIELGGAMGPSTPGGASQYDYLYATGDVPINSSGTTLDVNLINGFVPQAGDVFDILIADGTISGQYKVLQSLLPALSPGLQWTVIYGYNGPDLESVFGNGSHSLRLSVSAIVPEPSTYLILGTMLLFAALIRREKQPALVKSK